MSNKVTGDWVEKLLGSVGSFVTFETTDGIERSGRLSGFEMRKFSYNGSPVEFPTHIEINGDPNDQVPLERLSKIEIG